MTFCPQTAEVIARLLEAEAEAHQEWGETVLAQVLVDAAAIARGIVKPVQDDSERVRHLPETRD